MMRRLRRSCAATLVLLALGACAERSTAPTDQAPDAPVQVSAALAGSAVAWLSVEVTAADIPVPVVVTLAATGSTASGTVVVPSGPARTLVARGYDGEGTLTHRATATVDVPPGGVTTPVALRLLPVTDTGAGAAGDDRVALSSSELQLSSGGTARLAASVTTAAGAPRADAAVRWATLDPAVATVSRTGLVTASAPGTTQVVALSGGGAAVLNVTVQ